MLGPAKDNGGAAGDGDNDERGRGGGGLFCRAILEWLTAGQLFLLFVCVEEAYDFKKLFQSQTVKRRSGGVWLRGELGVCGNI